MPPSLNQAIQKLYTTFARYGLHAPITGWRIAPEDIHRIQAKSLKNLAAADLEKYSGKALTTWGEVKDLKHFLPRLLELAATQELDSGPHAFASHYLCIEILFSKLTYGEWLTWPQAEQQSLLDFMLAFWQASMNDERDISKILTAIGTTNTPLEPFLNDWLQNTAKFATKNLVNFAEQNLGGLTRNGSHRDCFWSDLPHQSQTLTHWLLAEPTLQHLENFAIENAEDPEAERALDLAGYLRNLRS